MNDTQDNAILLVRNPFKPAHVPVICPQWYYLLVFYFHYGRVFVYNLGSYKVKCVLLTIISAGRGLTNSDSGGIFSVS
jgi:hypothetical protein